VQSQWLSICTSDVFFFSESILYKLAEMAIIHKKMMKSGYKPKNESNKDKHLSIYSLSYLLKAFQNKIRNLAMLAFKAYLIVRLIEVRVSCLYDCAFNVKMGFA